MQTKVFGSGLQLTGLFSNPENYDCAQLKEAWFDTLNFSPLHIKNITSEAQSPDKTSQKGQCINYNYFRIIIGSKLATESYI